MSELERMLASFKAQLPPHELGYWYIESQPEATTIENDEPPREARTVYSGGDMVQIRGHAVCVRCGKQYKIPGYGNFHCSPERIEVTIAEAKAWVARDADKDGPCWGDVPAEEKQ